MDLLVLQHPDLTVPVIQQSSLVGIFPLVSVAAAFMAAILSGGQYFALRSKNNGVRVDLDPWAFQKKSQPPHPHNNHIQMGFETHMHTAVSPGGRYPL